MINVLLNASDVDWDVMIQSDTHVSEDRVKLIWDRDTDN